MKRSVRLRERHTSVRDSALVVRALIVRALVVRVVVHFGQSLFVEISSDVRLLCARLAIYPGHRVRRTAEIVDAEHPATDSLVGTDPIPSSG